MVIKEFVVWYTNSNDLAINRKMLSKLRKNQETKKGKLKDFFSVFKDFIMINDSFYDWYNISDNILMILKEIICFLMLLFLNILSDC